MKKILSILENIDKLFEQDEIKLEDKFKILDFIETAPSAAIAGMKMLILNAVVDVPFSGRTGIIPINNIVTDWVTENEKKLASVLWEKLRDYVKENHPAWSGKGLIEKYQETHESPINQSQSEYFPEFQEDGSLRIMLDVEVILEQ